MITNLNRNCLGTASFDGQFPGMRKAQDFIVYPMKSGDNEISIQSDNYFGQINLETGKGVLSARRAQYANGLWLQMSIFNKTAKNFTLSPEKLSEVVAFVKSTGGASVGSSFVTCDNSGALEIV